MSNGSSTETGKVINFLCRGCGAELVASVRDIGKTASCEHCQAENKVPLPKIKVGGGKAKPAQVLKATKPTPVDGAKPVGQHSEPAPAATPNPAPPPVPQEQPEPEKKQEVETPTEQLTPVTPQQEQPKPQQSTPKEKSPLGPMALVLIVFLVIGWGGVTLYKNYSFDLELADVSSPFDSNASSKTVTHDQLQMLVDLKRSASLAKETIEMDLEVSLAEMNSRGMVDQANIVKRAIEKKRQVIADTGDRFVAVMTNVHGIYNDKPEPVETAFESFAVTTAIESNPKAKAFIVSMLEALQKAPAEEPAIKEHFKKVFLE